jgi:phage shock protein A
MDSLEEALEKSHDAETIAYQKIEELERQLKETRKKVMSYETYVDIYNIIGQQQDKVDEEIMLAAKHIVNFKNGSSTQVSAIERMKELVPKKENIDRVMKKLDEMEP